MRSHRVCAIIIGAALTASVAPPCLAGSPRPTAPVAAEAESAPPAGAEIRQALMCWRRLVRVNTASDREGQVARAAVDQLFATRSGLELVEGLCTHLLDTETASTRSAIEVNFVDPLPCSDGTDGCFQPSTPAAERYEIFVRTQYSDAAEDPTVFVFGEYPSNPECSVIFFYQEAASSMAQALYHELLHVWFINAMVHEHRKYPTGHGVVNRCEFEDDFLQFLRAHSHALAVLEGRAPEPLMQANTPHSLTP